MTAYNIGDAICYVSNHGGSDKTIKLWVIVDTIRWIYHHELHWVSEGPNTMNSSNDEPYYIKKCSSQLYKSVYHLNQKRIIYIYVHIIVV